MKENYVILQKWVNNIKTDNEGLDLKIICLEFKQEDEGREHCTFFLEFSSTIQPYLFEIWFVLFKKIYY